LRIVNLSCTFLSKEVPPPPLLFQGCTRIGVIEDDIERRRNQSLSPPPPHFETLFPNGGGHSLFPLRYFPLFSPFPVRRRINNSRSREENSTSLLLSPFSSFFPFWWVKKRGLDLYSSSFLFPSLVPLADLLAGLCDLLDHHIYILVGILRPQHGRILFLLFLYQRSRFNAA